MLDLLSKLDTHPAVERLRGVFRRYDERAFYGLFTLMVVLYLLPIALSQFLPFSDLPGHMGMVGTLVHRGDPSASISKYYVLHPRFAPNSLELYFTWTVGRALNVVIAGRLFAALCVVALPLSVLYALRSFGRNHWLVFLTFPFSYPRILWFGFMGSTLAVSLMILSVATAHRLTRESHLGYPLGLACLLVLTGMSHPFFFAATLPLVFLVLAIGSLSQPKRWRSWVGFGAFLPATLVFYSWFKQTFAGLAASGPGGSVKESFVAHLLSKRPDWPVYRKWLSEWSLGAYRSTLETSVLRVLFWSFAVIGAAGVVYVVWRSVVSGFELRRKLRGFPAEPRRGWWWSDPTGIVVFVLFGCVLAAYLILPGVIHRPVYWWAVAQRLVTPLLIFAVLLVPRAVPGRFAAVFLLPAVVASSWYGAFLTKDFYGHWNRGEMKGLQLAVESIPKGQRVLALYDDRESHYSHFQLHFGACYYVAYRGGLAVPFPRAPGYEKIAWAYPKTLPPSPPWGKLHHFRYRRYGRYYDYFLIKRHADGKTRWNRFPVRCVSLVGHYGLWTVVKRLKKPRC